MLSYRHAFHAGNHADLIKHLTLMIVIQKLCQKDKAFCYLDTHAGAGLYHLDSEEAEKTAEYKQGISKLVAQDIINNASIRDYLELLAPYLSNQEYPGSPVIAKELLRPQDKMQLVELHNTEVDNLQTHFRRQTNTSVHHRNGFEALPALTPPKPARGVVLIDPAYEVQQDYHDVLNSIEKALKKWATGIYVVWYPLLGERPDQPQVNTKVGKSQVMLKKLAQLPVSNLLTAECVAQDPALGGMYGSGLAIINAPWQIDELINAALDELVRLVVPEQYGAAKVSWLVEPS